MSATVATDSRVSPAAGRWVVRHAPDWPDFAGAGWLDAVMSADVPDREHRKQGRAIGRWTLTAPDGRRLVVFLKRHFELPRRHGWLAKLLPGRPWSPGLQEWDHLEWAASVGLPAPRAVAVGEWRGPGGALRSFLAVEELADQLPLHEAVPLAADRLPAADFGRWKRGLTAEIARLTRTLHGTRHFHRDLYLCHFYIPEADTRREPDGWAGRVTMIDFHRLRRASWWLQAVARSKDLGQLLFSTFDVPGVTDRDRLRFWAHYRRGRVTSVVAAPVYRAAVARAKRYARHDAKRATGQ